MASDAGVKGGMIADIMLLTRWQKSENFAVMFELPVMRPILFILAFDMLQFEPQLNFEFSKKIGDNSKLILSPGVGLSLHYTRLYVGYGE
ncbi:MAG: hypothetical protein IPO21_02240 [Bacteroidales bacterium]|nr:hypothetical protein [Bacteroidales bacterium]